MNAESMDAGDVLVFVLGMVYMIAAMAASVYLACDGDARMSVFGFVALWLRELVLLVLLAVGLLVAAVLKVWNAARPWFPRGRGRGLLGENAL